MCRGRAPPTAPPPPPVAAGALTPRADGRAQITWIATIVAVLFLNLNLPTALVAGLIVGVGYTLFARAMYRQQLAALQARAPAVGACCAVCPGGSRRRLRGAAANGGARRAGRYLTSGKGRSSLQRQWWVLCEPCVQHGSWPGCLLARTNPAPERHILSALCASVHLLSIARHV